MRSVPDGQGGLLAAANTLGDLTNRKNGYGHPLVPNVDPTLGIEEYTAFPYDTARRGVWRIPTKRESADLTYWPGALPTPHRRGKGYATATYQRSPRGWWKQWELGNIEFWGLGEITGDGHNPFNPYPSRASERDLGQPYLEEWTFASVNSGWLLASDPDRKVLSQTAAARHATDVVMTDIIGFDVKAWDPGTPLFRYTIPATAKRRMKV